MSSLLDRREFNLVSLQTAAVKAALHTQGLVALDHWMAEPATLPPQGHNFPPSPSLHNMVFR
jgi:hypothetical protein